MTSPTHSLPPDTSVQPHDFLLGGAGSVGAAGAFDATAAEGTLGGVAPHPQPAAADSEHVSIIDPS